MLQSNRLGTKRLTTPTVPNLYKYSFKFDKKESKKLL